MKLMPDNTGLIAATRCLNHKAKDESDIKDFLQFAVSIMIGDYTVAEFEAEAAPYEDSKNSTDFLREKFSIKIPRKRYDDAIYDKICDSAFSEFERYFSNILIRPTDKNIKKWSIPFSKYKNTLDKTSVILNNIKKLDTLREADRTREDKVLEITYKKSMDAVKYLIIKNEESFKRLLRNRKLEQQPFSKKEVAVLDSVLRILLNRNIAKEFQRKEMIYVPAYNRSELITDGNVLLMTTFKKELDGLIKKSIEEKRNLVLENEDSSEIFYKQIASLELPVSNSLGGLLLSKSNGNPKDLLKIAVDYKNKFNNRQIDSKIIRLIELDKLSTINNSNLLQEKLEIRKEIIDIINQLTKQKLTDTNFYSIALFFGTNIIDFFLNLPVANFLSEFIKDSGILNYVRPNRNILLTNIVNDIMTFQGNTDGDIKYKYIELIKQSGIKN